MDEHTLAISKQEGKTQDFGEQISGRRVKRWKIIPFRILERIIFRIAGGWRWFRIICNDKTTYHMRSAF